MQKTKDAGSPIWSGMTEEGVLRLYGCFLRTFQRAC